MHDLSGVSGLRVNAHDRQTDVPGGASDTFNGDSNLLIGDFLWKCAPNGNATQRNFKFQSEYFYRDESGDVAVDNDGNSGMMDYNGNQWGWYAQGVYQFIPHWRAALRYDRLSADNNLKVTRLGGFPDNRAVIDASGLDNNGYHPQRYRAMLDWSPSEFSRLRLQYDRDGVPHQPDRQRVVAAIVLAASAAILILANNPHGGEHLKDLLVGQVLWVDRDQLVPVAMLYTLILSVWFGFSASHRTLLFYILFALAITASVQLVGVYLVFASLIIPALAVRPTGKYALFVAYLLGIASYAVGLTVSALLDLPAGAVIVWVLALFGVTGSLLIAHFTATPVTLHPSHNEQGLES